MLRKIFAPFFVLTLLALTLLGSPSNVLAGGVCGGTYTAEAGNTVEKLAAMCGTSPEAIYAANPGITSKLSVGQVLTIPSASGSASTGTSGSVDTSYYYNSYIYQPAVSNTGVYAVQKGDTFASIANHFGISSQELWGANPQIWDVNLLSAGQVLFIPVPYYNFSIGTPAAPALNPGVITALSYNGTISKRSPRGTVILVNKAKAEVYISLRTTRADGTNAINEFPVSKTAYVDIPVGWIDYVAWVGGVKYMGGFKLREGVISTITFNKSKVVVE